MPSDWKSAVKCLTFCEQVKYLCFFCHCFVGDANRPQLFLQCSLNLLQRYKHREVLWRQHAALEQCFLVSSRDSDLNSLKSYICKHLEIVGLKDPICAFLHLPNEHLHLTSRDILLVLCSK